MRFEKGTHLSSNVQNTLAGTVAIVTGASSGIGEASRQEWGRFAAENIPEKLQPEDIAESIAYMVTRHRRSSIAELWAMPTSQA